MYKKIDYITYDIFSLFLNKSQDLLLVSCYSNVVRHFDTPGCRRVHQPLPAGAGQGGRSKSPGTNCNQQIQP